MYGAIQILKNNNGKTYIALPIHYLGIITTHSTHHTLPQNSCHLPIFTLTSPGHTEEGLLKIKRQRCCGGAPFCVKQIPWELEGLKVSGFPSLPQADLQGLSVWSGEDEEEEGKSVAVLEVECDFDGSGRDGVWMGSMVNQSRVDLNSYRC